MATEHRISRKQLLKEPDSFQVASTRIMNFILQNRGPLLGLLGGLVLLAGVIGFIQSNKASHLKEQEALYFEMTQIAEKGSASDADNVIKQLKDTIEKFDEDLVKQRAELLLADSYYKFEQYKNAQEAYQKLIAESGNRGLNHDLALRGLAASQEAAGDAKSAISTYKSIIDSPGSLPVFYVYVGLARSYEAAGDTQNAILTLREAKTKYPDHGDLDQINSRLSKLEAKS